MNLSMSAAGMRVWLIEPATKILDETEIESFGDLLAHVIAYNVRKEYLIEYRSLVAGQPWHGLPGR